MAPDNTCTPSTTSKPSDWTHGRILVQRNFRNDCQKPFLTFGRLFGVALMLMLYTIGFYFGYDPNAFQNEQVVETGGNPVRLFDLDGAHFVYPERLRLAGDDWDWLEQVALELNSSAGSSTDGSSTGTGIPTETVPLDQAAFIEQCERDVIPSAWTELCIYLASSDNDSGETVYLYYPGKETATPFAPPLAGAQHAIHQAIWNTKLSRIQLATGVLPNVTQIQRTPQMVDRQTLAENADLALVLVPGLLQSLAAAIMCMLLIGTPHTEKATFKLQSFIVVGVKWRTYVLSWLFYYATQGILTAVALTLVSLYYHLLPLSNGFLLFCSHYLGIVGMDAVFLLLSQVIENDELAQGTPWLAAFASIALATPILILTSPTFPLMYLATAISPYCGMMHYYAVYTTYGYSGVGTGIHPGDGSVQESGLLGVYLAQVACILLYTGALLYLTSPSRGRSRHGHGSNDNNNTNTLNDDNNTVEEQGKGDTFEPLPPGSDVLLQVRGVHHTYSPGYCCSGNVQPTQVLHGLDMDVCRGEVFGYLGHNGSGKTTSCKLLSAEQPLQDGSVTYHFGTANGGMAQLKAQGGVMEDAHRIRGNIGVCPQHDTGLFEDLTARETIQLFARLKGGIPKQSPDQSDDDAINQEVERRLRDVAFTSPVDADRPVGTYSGGMKRKVSIALALLGSPEVVYLDEPTAGMDPYNRRQIWDMIIAAKAGRSIILTTHFLDEADVLSDRIGILKDGKLITCGTSLFLKHHSSAGYTLRYELPVDNNSVDVDIKSMIDQAEPLPLEIPGRYEWRLQHGSEPKFPEVLKALGQSGATNVSLDLTTLEEVFLETGKEDTGEEEDNEGETSNSDPEAIGNNDNTNQAEDLEAGTTATSAADRLRQIWKPKGSIKPLGSWSKFFLVTKFMMANAWKMGGSTLLNIAMPLAYVLAGLLVSSFVGVPDAGVRVVPNPILLSPYMAVTRPEPKQFQFFGIPNIASYFVSNITWIDPMIPTPEPKVLADYFDDPSFPVFGGFYDGNSTLQYNPQLTPFALQIAMSVMSNVVAAVSGQAHAIATTIQQLPYITDPPYRVDLLVLPMCMALGFNGVAYSVLDILLLKADGIIRLFQVAGVTEWSTYLGVMFYKITSSFSPFFIAVLVLGYALQVTIMGNAGRWLGTIGVMLSYAYSTTPIGLIMAKRFVHGDYKAVAQWFPGMYMTFVSLPYIAWSSALQALPDSRDLIMLIGDIICVIPPVAFQRGLGAVIQVSTKFDDPDLTWEVVWSWESRIWYTIAVMVGIGTLEWIYLYRLTTTRPATTGLQKNDPESAIKPIDVALNPELQEQHEKSMQDDMGINARSLVKVFRVAPQGDKGKKARKADAILKRSVKGVSFGIRKNEILALLGPNGAGKSVTMGMLASEYTPEHGQVALEGEVASRDTRDVGHLYRQGHVAYCPQFDALFPKMTVLQHLKFYAQIRGLDWEEDSTKSHIDSIIHLLNLEKHKDKASTQLSGGYKRRLSLGLAMIGYPKVMMVDECTTGMDPGARHLVWDVLKPQFLHEDFDLPAIVLSSHYMDECEKLGDTIAIMIDGEIVTVGTLPYLEGKYCTSYFVEISMDPLAEHTMTDSATFGADALVEAFEKEGMKARVYESLPYRFKLQLPFQEGNQQHDQQLAGIFGLLEREKNALGIKFYSVELMNLEKIFIDLSRKQFEA